MDGRARAAGLGALGGAVLARVVLPSPAGRAQRVGGGAHRPRCGAVAHGGGGVAPRRRAPLVVARRRGAARARGALRRALFRTGHHTAGGRRGVRAVGVVGGGGRHGGDGPGARRGGAGARHRRAAAPALDPAGGMRVGRHGRARRPVAVEGRLLLAERDALGLGAAADPRAASLLARLGATPPATQPRTAGELYAWWLASPLAADLYPASLAVWHRSGEPAAEIRLASVDLRPSLLAALVRSPETARGPRVERLDGSPGVHYVLVAPLASGDVLTVGVGPRTRLIAADRVARFLQGDIGAGLPYVPTLSLPSPGPPAESARVIWTRTGWSVRGERRLELSGGVRHVHLRVDLQPGGPWALLVRGALGVVLDAGLLGAVWLASLLLVAGGPPRLQPVLTGLRTSYRVRLTAALAGLFVVPVMAFALWSFAQLRDDARQD